MLNKVILIGRITKDPELRQAGNSQCVNFTLAVNRNFKNKDGVKETDFINCIAWSASANFISQYVRKGNLLAVDGNIETRSYDAQDGRRVYVTEVRCNSVQIVDSKNSNTNEYRAPVSNTKINNFDDITDFSNEFEKNFAETPSLNIESDDLPFY